MARLLYCRFLTLFLLRLSLSLSAYYAVCRDSNTKTDVLRFEAVMHSDKRQLGKSYEHGGLLGRRILIVDEVDDTRTTLM